MLIQNDMRRVDQFKCKPENERYETELSHLRKHIKKLTDERDMLKAENEELKIRAAPCGQKHWMPLEAS